MNRASSVGQIYAAFEEMRIKHDRLTDAQKFYSALRETKRISPLAPKKFGVLFAPSQAGKSTTVKHYIETVVVNDALERGLFPETMDRSLIAARQKMVLHVTLSAKAKVKSLATDILMALGDPYAASGSTDSLLKRSYDHLRKCGTELIFIDEIQHLSHRTSRAAHGGTERSGLHESTEVTDTLKNMMIKGVVPMMFVGIPEAYHFIFNEDQLARRCLKEIDFNPVDFLDEGGRNDFVTFVGKLGLKLQREKLFEDQSNFVEGNIPLCLHEVSNGLIGMVCNLVCQASVLAFEGGARSVTRQHLSMATDMWAIPKRIVDYNPFAKGIRGHKIWTTGQPVQTGG